MATKLRTALAVTVALLAAPGVARAASVHVESAPSGERTLVYQGDPGEANLMTIRWDRAASQFVVEDPGAFLLLAGTGCQPADVEAVACDGAGIITATLDGGDGDDEIDDDVPPVPGSSVRYVQINGGEGDDRLIGSGVAEGFNGGPGADYMSGGRGVDTATEDGVAPDGSGVTVTLDLTANDGLPDEGDDIHSDIENIVGGDGNDMLVGNNGRHHLYGAGGDDRIFGKGGADVVDGGPGADVVSGGSGRDQVVADDGAADPRVDCGPGWDEAVGNDGDGFDANCEQYVVSGHSRFHQATKESGRPPGLPAVVSPTVIRRSRYLLLFAGCRDAGCSGRVRMTGSVRSQSGATTRTRTLGRASFRAHAGQMKRVRLKLTARTRRLARRVRRGTVYVVGYGERGGATLTRRRVRVR